MQHLQVRPCHCSDGNCKLITVEGLFSPRALHVGFVVDSVMMVQGFLTVLQFYFDDCHSLMFQSLVYNEGVI